VGLVIYSWGGVSLVTMAQAGLKAGTCRGNPAEEIKKEFAAKALQKRVFFSGLWQAIAGCYLLLIIRPAMPKMSSSAEPSLS
jgi:hypothetical protein